MSRIIYIDTSENKKIKIVLQEGDKKIEQSMHSRLIKSEAALPLIDKILKDKNLSLEDINEVKVATGQGSFTGLRVGASIANALGYLLKIPVNGKKVGEIALPVYNK